MEPLFPIHATSHPIAIAAISTNDDIHVAGSADVFPVELMYY